MQLKYGALGFLLIALLPAPVAATTNTTVPADHLNVGGGETYDPGAIGVSADHQEHREAAHGQTPTARVQRGPAHPPVSIDPNNTDCTFDPSIGLAPTSGVCWVGTPVLTGPVTAPAAPQGPSPAQQAAVVAVDYFRSLDLPSPQPEMSAAGGGVSGAVHSLDLHMPQELIFTDPETAFGPLVVHVFATSTVAWGDGTSDVYNDTGGRWGQSTIIHTWSRSGHYTITVGVNWSANWTFGRYSGVASGFRTAGVIANWPVYELQAVLTN